MNKRTYHQVDSYADAVCSILKGLDNAEIPFVLLGPAAGTLARETGDVDISVPDAILQNWPRYLLRLAEDNGFGLVQILRHEVTAYYGVLNWRDSKGRHRYVRLDVCSDFIREGRLLIKGDLLLKNTAEIELTPHYRCKVPSPSIAFAYYILKQLGKRSLNISHFDYLNRLWLQDPQGCRVCVSQVLGRAASRIWQLFDSNTDSESVQRVSTGLEPTMKAAGSVSLSLFVREFWRKAERWLRPTGILVAVLGPDGAGKSSAISALSENILPAFRQCAIRHFRPQLRLTCPANAKINTNPHEQSKRSCPASCVKLLYYVLLYRFGYWISFRPALVRSTLFIFDRYYMDIFVDPLRYRYGGPIRLARLLQKAVPGPDLMFCLTAPAAVLQERKSEVSADEASRQSDAYATLASDSPGQKTIITDKPLKQVATEMESQILTFMASRTRRRYGA